MDAVTRPPATRWTLGSSIWLALVGASVASVSVLWGMSWSGAHDAVSAALSDQLVAQAGLVGAHLRDVPVDVLVSLGAGHATAAVGGDLELLIAASGLHDAALLGPDGVVLGSGGSWLPAAADADLIRAAAAGHAVAGPLYRGEDGALYLAAYAPLPGRPEWVVAVEGSATLGAVDELGRRQAVASVLVVAATGGLGILLASLVARPLRALEAQLQQVAPGDPPGRVVPAGPREVFRVGEAARRLLEAIRQRDQEVDEAHREQVSQVTRLAAAIAHEVRNPLNAMSLSTERFARLDDPERRRALGERLRGQIGELEAIVGRLLDLTRPIAPARAPIDPATVARAVAAEFVDLEVAVGGACDEWSTDATLLAEVLRNLLLNAQQAGAARALVRLAPRAIEVEDDGPGIADPAPVFDWFHTTRAKGSGLGLPVSRRIAEALGARLWIVSPKPAVFRLEWTGGDA